MAPLAIVQNNTDVKEKGLQLFYVNNQDNLGVSLKNSADEGQDPLSFFEAASDAYTGIIPVKSEIGSAVLNGLNLVIAITKHKPKDQCEKPTVNDISIVSPIYKVLDQTNITNTTATVISNKDGNKGGNNAWAYYLRGSDTGKVDIVEYEVPTGNKKTVAHLNVDPDCSLAAFYDTANKGRSIIYQDNAEAQLVEYRVNIKQPIFIEDSGGAMPNTSLAVAYYEGYAYLYYTDKFMNLFRIVKDKAGNWGSHKKLGAETNPDPSSQFTAIGANGVIHLFYQATDNPNITHYRDQPIVEK